MPQNKTPILRGDTDPYRLKEFFAGRTHRLTITDIDGVCIFVAWRGKMASTAFAEAYGKDPETVVALMQHLAETQQTTTATDWLRVNFDRYLTIGAGIHRDSKDEIEVNGQKLKPMRLRSINAMTDDELAALFSKESGMKISKALVKKFRQSRTKSKGPK
jgi:hypothetical protein